MTLFAGIYSRHAGEPVSGPACAALRDSLTRHPTDEVREYGDERCFLVKVDIEAFGEPAFHQAADGSVSLLAGEALVADGEVALESGRLRELERLHKGWREEDWALLRSARGTFCAVHYQPESGKLFLIADKLCVRPLYYWMDERTVVFATALRVLEALDAVPKEMDLRAVTEMTGLGYPLGGRTPYAGVSLLRGGEIVEVSGDTLAQRSYWRWDEIEPSRETEGDLLLRAREQFQGAVGRRQRADRRAVAYLSGGLDSRAAVAALLEQGAEVHTFNFALRGTQDSVFGDEYARRAGTMHEAVPKEEGDLTPDYSLLMARAWRDAKRREELPVERPCLIWSGEGGSVAFGHVHLGREIVELMRASRTDEAIETYLKREGASIALRLLKKDVSEALAQTLHTGVREELDALHAADPARSFYLFLLLNDQRRKLAEHFENIDLHRLEFQLPFFDAEFLALVVAVPLDLCLGHAFYTKWLKLFPPPTASVAWQTYPGHEPCPVPAPERELAYQWDDGFQASQRAHLKRELAGQAARVLSARPFPNELLRRGYLKIASLIYRTGLRDYSYVIQSAWLYYTYWNLCGGRYVLGSPQHAPGPVAGGAALSSNALGREAGLTSGGIE